jgi:tetratricopeptide (TPR) repeat protein
MKRDSSSTGSRSSDSDKGSSDKLKAALKQAQSNPADERAWDDLEALASETQKPDDVAAGFRKVLAPGLAPALVTQVGQRALRFFEEWYAGETAVVVGLLEKILALDPGADWALERLTILRSVNEEWAELLAAHDRVLEGLPDSPRRRRILQDAAAVARDSGNSAQAASYLRALFEVTPASHDVSSELERLLEKLGDHAGLAQVLGKRLAVLSGPEVVDVRERVATLYLDRLHEPAKALDEIEKLLASPTLADDRAPCVLAERILGDASLAQDLRRRALGLLRARHLQQGRVDPLVSALRVATQFVGPGERQALAREAADLLERKGDLPAAREQLVELVGLEPDDGALRARLKFLAEVTAAPDAYVRGLAAAAGATQDAGLQVSLWLEAAEVEEARGKDAEAARGLCRQALASAAASPEQVLRAVRKLVGLLRGEGHAEERLGLLEKQAELESEARVRRWLLGEAADLAQALGQIDRALGLWEKRLAADPSDAKALGRVVEILERAERWKDLAAALSRRAAADVPLAVKRADLLHVAAIARDRLQDPAQAIAALDQTLALAPSDREAETALFDLLANVERWKDLLVLGTQAGERDQRSLLALFVRLGDACQDKLANPEAAARWYGRALAIEPRTPGLRESLHALAENEVARPAAIEGLVRLAAATDAWQATLELLPDRLEMAADDAAEVRLHREAALLEETRGQNPAGALGHWIEVLQLCPDDADAEAHVLRLAEATGEFAGVAKAIEQISAAPSLDGERRLHLLLVAGHLLADKVQDHAAALACFGRALVAAPANRDARLGAVRMASSIADWQAAVDAALPDPLDVPALFDSYLPLMERAAISTGERGARNFGKILSASLARKQGLAPAVGRAVEERIADYPVGGEGAAAWKEKALLRARDYDPTHLPTLRRLAEAQQGRGGKPLFDTLMQIAAQSPRDLDRLVEAIEVASRDKKDLASARSAFSALFDRAAGLLRSGQAAAGKSSAPDCLLQAAEGLGNLLGASRDRSEIRRAVDYLMEAARLPITPEAAQSLRARAGELAMEVDKKLARELLRQTVEQDPKNHSAAKALARLLEETDMLPDLIALRRRELEVTAHVEERLGLRLDIARLGEIVESRTGRLEMLVANLEDCPGHAPTLAALSALLRSRARFDELSDILVAQARKLEEQKDALAAAELWKEAATILDKHLGDHARAIAAYEKTAALAADPSAMEALARLYQNAGEPLLAATWLEQRLAAGMSGDKVKAACKLAETYRNAGQSHRAVAALERALAEDPSAVELWKMLAGLHREAGHHEALVRVQTECAIHSEDREAVVAAAREVLAVCQQQLHAPARTVPALERAVALAPDDRSLHLALADGLRAAGDLPRARAVLEGLLQAYGRRQSRERSALHLQIASIARDEKNPEIAAQHLEQAATTLFDSMEVQLGIAEVAEERGDFARAEKAYRTLLVLSRRGHAGDATVTAGEVLVRLRRVANRQGQAAQAADHLEQAVARALHDPVEARRIQSALLADGDHETLLALLARRRGTAAHITEEAAVVCEQAEVLDKIGRSAEALSSLLDILARVPDSAEAHRLARAIAAKSGAADAYLAAVGAAADKLRRADDAPCLVDLLLRAADVAENDLGLLDRALGFLRRAEQTGCRGPEVASAVTRVAVKAGDSVELSRAIGLLRRLLEAAATPADKADVCFRLAEAQLGQEDAREDGLAMLAQAVEFAPDLPRATAIVRAAQVPDAALAQILPVYEKLARASKDERLLLDFLDRKSALPGAGMAELREGVELAVALGEGERAERLLGRAIQIASSSDTGRPEGIWAVADLARRLSGRGDLAGAASVLEGAKDDWSNPRLTSLVRETAKTAAAGSQHAAVASRLYQELRELYPTDREIWEPLLSLLAQLGERDALQRLSEDLVEKLMSRGDRNTVRMAWATFLLQNDPAGATEAVSNTLRDVLTEEPGHTDALAMLADLHERRGEVAEAVSLLSDGLAKSDDRGAGRATLARRLGDLVKKADPGQAKSVYRSALAAWLPDAAIKRSLQQALVELLTDESETAERAGLLEDLLLGETGQSAATQALALFELRLQLGDEAGAERALRFGRERAPGDPQVFDQLGRFYTQRERWSDAVVLLGHEAGRLSDKDKATRLLRRVAHLQREKLGDPRAAAQTLRQAVQTDPSDFDLVRELCDSLAEAQDPTQAVAVLAEILAGATTPPVRIGLLRLRAEISARHHDDEAAVRDLEEAIALGAGDATPDLAAALSRVAGRGAGSGDKDVARTATLRLAEVLRASGDHDQADQVLFRWIESYPDDRDWLYKMRDIFHTADRWESAASTWARLVHLEDGEAKAEAVLALADAFQKLDKPEEAIPWLASVLDALPDHPALQSRLASLYAATGNVVEAARLRHALADREPDENQRYVLYLQIGQSLLAAGEGTGAVAALEKAVALPPAERGARTLLLDAYVAAGAVDRAQALLSDLLAGAKTMKPEELGALYHRQSRLAAQLGDHDGQLSALKKALDADRRSVAIANELADLAEAIGDDDLALRALRVVAASPLKDGKVLGQAYLRQARIAHRSKDRARAIIFVKRALQEDPDLEEARALLDQLR